MSSALYTREILRLAVSIPHEERLQSPDGSAEVRSRTCGSRVIADLGISSTGEISRFGIEINACALGQASAAILSREAMGKTVDEIVTARAHLFRFLEGEENHPGDWKDMNLIASAKDHKGRHAAILLPYDAVISAFAQASSQPEKVV